MSELIRFFLVLLFWCLWGAFENRVWKEHGENFILNHFKTYHVAMAAFVVLTAFMGVYTPAQFIFVLFWAPLMLDVVWWLIRYYDFQKDYEKAKESYNEPNAWHLQTDWDNWLGVPLLFNCYWWWTVFGVILFIIGIFVGFGY